MDLPPGFLYAVGLGLPSRIADLSAENFGDSLESLVHDTSREFGISSEQAGDLATAVQDHTFKRLLVDFEYDETGRPEADGFWLAIALFEFPNGSFLLNPETSRPLAGPLDDDTQIREAVLSVATEFLVGEDWGCSGEPPTNISVQLPMKPGDLRTMFEEALDQYDERDTNYLGEGMLQILNHSDYEWEGTDSPKLVDDYLEKVTQTRLPPREPPPPETTQISKPQGGSMERPPTRFMETKREGQPWLLAKVDPNDPESVSRIAKVFFERSRSSEEE